MNTNLYYETLYLFLDRKQIPELLAFWRQSVYLGSFGTVTRTIINEGVSELAKYYKLRITDEMTFGEFLDRYYEKLYFERCDKNPFDCIDYFAQTNEPELLKQAMKKAEPYFDFERRSGCCDIPSSVMGESERSNLEQAEKIKNVIAWVALFRAAKYKQLDLVKYLMKTHTYSKEGLLQLLETVVKNDDFALTKFLLEQGIFPKNWDNMGPLVEIAAKNANKQLLKLFFDHGSRHWAHGQRGAREGNHPELRRFFSRKLAGLDAEL